MTDSGRVILQQAWNWHDETGNGSYTIGEDQFFLMDGSCGTVQCNRFLPEPIVDSDSSLEVSFQVTCGKTYRILLYDSGGLPAVILRIDSDGVFAFFDGERWQDSGGRLTFLWEGIRLWTDDSIGPTWWQSNRPWAWAVRSSLHTCEFLSFDFSIGRFTFRLDDVEFYAPLCDRVSDIAKIEFRTETVEPGTAIWLDHLRQSHGREIIEYESFPWFWNDTGVREYYPEDKWFDCRTAMKHYRWLEVRSKYGDVVCALPQPVLRGSVEFEVMAADARQEVAFAILERGDKRGFEKVLWVMVFNGLWTTGEIEVYEWDRILAAVDAGLIPPGGRPYCESFDPPLQAESGKPYTVKMEWDGAKGFWSLSIDGEVRREKGGGTERPISFTRGVDTIRFHPGSHVYPHGGVYCYSYWGALTVRSFDTLEP